MGESVPVKACEAWAATRGPQSIEQYFYIAHVIGILAAQTMLGDEVVKVLFV
jgi:hypothetical protein